MEGSVVAEFGPWETIKPSSGMITCDATQAHDDRFVDRFRLPIGLGMKGGTHAELDTRHLEQVTLDVAGEMGS